MAWSGGTYTKGNNGTGGWVGDASLGIGIEAGRHDTQDNDFATGINQCLNKDGSNAATGNLNLGGFLPTNIGAGTAAAPAICAGNDVNTGIFSPAADQIGIATNGTERVRIDSTGKVGIGTTAPAQKLQIAETTNVTNIQLLSNTSNGAAATSAIYFQNDATNPASFIVQNSSGNATLAGANSLNIGTNGAYPVSFITNATERMRIDSTGRLGINALASHMLEVRSTSTSFYPLYANMDAASSQSNGAGVFVKKDNDSTTANRLLLFLINGGATGSGMITANGASAAAFGSFSDARLKENITDLPSQLANILALRPVEFDYKDGSGHQIGFIAQEVQEVYPDLVSSNDEYLTLTDLNKNDARVIKAIQELNAKVEALKARVAELEAA